MCGIGGVDILGDVGIVRWLMVGVVGVDVGGCGDGVLWIGDGVDWFVVVGVWFVVIYVVCGDGL